MRTPPNGKDRLAALAEDAAPEAPHGAGPSRPLIQDPRFRRAWAGSVALHVLLFGWTLYHPSETKARFYGSGTAVSLVGADQIPGGSQKGKSGDRPEDLKEKAVPVPAAPKAPVAKKPPAPSKEEIENIRRIRQLQAEQAEKAARERKERDERERKQRERDARLKEIRERREREDRWRRQYEANLKREADRRQKEASQAARAQTPPAGHPGEGGGDGQGGGSIGGGGGGVARTELERYYGLLGERVRSFWTIPLNLTDLDRLSVTIAVDVDRGGGVRGLKIEKSSGNKVYDEAALRAVERAATPAFPVPPNSVKESVLALGFRFCGASFCR